MPNGVNYQAFDGFINPSEVKGRYGIAPMAPTIFAPGRMTVQKGMDLLVEAVPMVLASYPEARFIISGEGPEKDAVVRRAYEVGAAGAIVFLGHVPRWQYIDLMRACDINGFLVDATAGGLAHGIGSLLADHEHCRALGANGRRAVEEKFNWDTVAAYTEGVYQVVAR